MNNGAPCQGRVSSPAANKGAGPVQGPATQADRPTQSVI